MKHRPSSNSPRRQQVEEIGEEDKAYSWDNLDDDDDDPFLGSHYLVSKFNW